MVFSFPIIPVQPKGLQHIPCSDKRIQHMLGSSFLLAEAGEMAGSTCFTLKGLQSHEDDCSPRLLYLSPFPTAVIRSSVHPILNSTLQIYLSGQRIQIKNETSISLAWQGQTRSATFPSLSLGSRT